MTSPERPLRLGFLGTGWIGRHRLQALLQAGLAQAAVIADADPVSLAEAATLAPTARRAEGLAQLLGEPLDGVVIATPSAAHAAQSVAVLQSGLPVFCQKPLGRDGPEVASVLRAARQADRRLGVDLSYRHLAGMDQVKAWLRSGELGQVFALELQFHNAYGPGKPWFYDRTLSGGGCLIDLGIHLIDLGLWLLDNPPVSSVQGQCYSQGRPLAQQPDAVEDFASARLVLEGGVSMEVACSWNLPIGSDAEIGMRIYGSRGGIGLRNVDGSFYDFVMERFDGRQRALIAQPPDAWGGRALLAWAEALQRSAAYDAEADDLQVSADVLDRIYATALQAPA